MTRTRCLIYNKKICCNFRFLHGVNRHSYCSLSIYLSKIIYAMRKSRKKIPYWKTFPLVLMSRKSYNSIYLGTFKCSLIQFPIQMWNATECETFTTHSLNSFIFSLLLLLLLWSLFVVVVAVVVDISLLEMNLEMWAKWASERVSECVWKR